MLIPTQLDLTAATSGIVDIKAGDVAVGASVCTVSRHHAVLGTERSLRHRARTATHRIDYVADFAAVRPQWMPAFRGSGSGRGRPSTEHARGVSRKPCSTSSSRGTVPASFRNMVFRPSCRISPAATALDGAVGFLHDPPLPPEGLGLSWCSIDQGQARGPAHRPGISGCGALPSRWRIRLFGAGPVLLLEGYATCGNRSASRSAAGQARPGCSGDHPGTR
jgi:hypothetical protein